MKAATQEWVDKAERYWNGVGVQLRLRKEPNLLVSREFRGRTAPHYGATVLGSRLCVCTYLTARLEEIAGERTIQVDIMSLADELIAIEPDWIPLRADVLELAQSAKGYRFSDEPLDRDDAIHAMSLCARIRSAIRLSLDLPV